MKFLLVLLVAGFAAAIHREVIDADKGFLKRQKDVLTLLNHVFSHFQDAAHQEDGRTYEPLNHLTSYQDPTPVKKLVRMYKMGDCLKQSEIFCLFTDHHRHEMILLFEALYYAKDWGTFMKMARWARVHLNGALFVYSVKVALLHRQDTYGIRLTPAYELNPHMFVTNDAITKAYSAKMRNKDAVVRVEFTGTIHNPEQHVAYYGEDIGMNSHHSHWHMDFPFWWKKDYPTQMDRKGELFWYAHHQLTTRFDLERLSNNLDVVKPLAWDKPIEHGFSPETVYRTGDEFPVRPDDMMFHDIHGIVSVTDMKAMEYRILHTIDANLYVAENGTFPKLEVDTGINTLGEIIEASEHSVNPGFYKSIHTLSHVMLGKITDPEHKYGMPPGVMEHFETSTRDPAFFRLHKYIDNLFRTYKEHLPPYTKEGLAVDGLKVNDVEVTELKTFFEDFEFDLTQGMELTGTGDDAHIKAVMARINHKPFHYTIKVNSDVKRTGMVRIFLAPKYDWYGEEIDITHNAWQTVGLDKFLVPLDPGENVIVRKSDESTVTIPDPPSYAQLVKEVEDALSGTSVLKVHKFHRHCGIPDRMLLPKGKVGGMEFMLLVVVTDGGADKGVTIHDDHIYGGSTSLCGIRGEKYPDKRALGFPFDRYIHSVEDFVTPNMFCKDVVITHVPHA
uniref:Hemocyanin subunit 3 n=1 Tax=Xibalbanus tulumensis TaxID=1519145 RepID=D0R094_XIBTU|nr:hemocyanin subunit 3 precursor [Xibalbanus tulumensis]